MSMHTCNKLIYYGSWLRFVLCLHIVMKFFKCETLYFLCVKKLSLLVFLIKYFKLDVRTISILNCIAEGILNWYLDI